MTDHTRLPAIVFCVLFWTVISAANAQVTVPRSAEAGSIAKQAEQRRMPAFPTESEAPSLLRVEAPEGAQDVHLRLREIRVEGSTVYDEETLSAYYADLVPNKDMTLLALYTAAARITQRYRDDGYLLANAYLPPQDLGAGRATIAVVEGYIAAVEWTGDPLDSDIARSMGEELLASRPFSGRVLEDVMLRLNELPSVSAKATMTPYAGDNKEPGAIALQIEVERTHISGSAGINNSASRHLGVWQDTLQADISGLMTEVDRLSLSSALSLHTEFSRYVRGEYRLPVHHSGSTLFAGISNSKSVPGFTLRTLDVLSKAESYWVGLTQPVLRSRKENLTLESRITFNSQTTDVLGVPLYEDRTRSLTLSMDYSYNDDWGGSNLVDADVIKGFNLFNPTRTGSTQLSRARGHNDASKLTLMLTRMQAINGPWSALLTANGQLSNAGLLSSEQFGVGGTAIGRGYDASEITGDEGVSGSLELRYNDLALAPGFSLQPFGFYDVGKVWNQVAGGSTLSLASAGGGVRIQLPYSMRADVTVAKPLTYTPATAKQGSEGKDTRIGLSFTAQY